VIDPVTVFKAHGGQMRMSEALAAGVSRYRLYRMLDDGVLERVSRGVYRLTELPPISDPDLAVVALRVPRAVVCLVSALAFHDLTTQVPHAVWIALPRGADTPRLDHPPLSVHRFGPDAFEAGVEVHELDGVEVKVYGAEKTLADVFKFRNQVGMDVALEALGLYAGRRRRDVEALLEYARICRVERLMRPYLEALL
jgi:predicted transcriptional regulator of viral defense system